MFSSRLWNLFIDSFPKMFIRGLTVTIPLTAIAFSLAMVIAVIVALVQFANIKVLKQICRFYIWIFRGTPLLVQLFIVFFGLMNVGLVLEPFLAAVIVFALNEGAYGAETVRASLESVPSCQLEAGQCAGLSYLQTIFQNRFATGDAYGVSVIVQCIDFHVKGYFIGSDYYRNGNV